MIEDIEIIKKKAAVFILEHESTARHESIDGVIELFKREIAGETVSSDAWGCAINGVYLALALDLALDLDLALALARDLDLALELDLAAYLLPILSDYLIKADIPQLIIKNADYLEMDSWHENSNDIHECNTTHCMAGFAELAYGEMGEYIVKHFGHQIGGHILFLHSTGQTVDFHCSNEEAIEAIKKMASI